MVTMIAGAKLNIKSISIQFLLYWHWNYYDKVCIVKYDMLIYQLESYYIYYKDC